jgi:hypothetical protein
MRVAHDVFQIVCGIQLTTPIKRTQLSIDIYKAEKQRTTQEHNTRTQRKNTTQEHNTRTQHKNTTQEHKNTTQEHKRTTQNKEQKMSEHNQNNGTHPSPQPPRPRLTSS